MLFDLKLWTIENYKVVVPKNRIGQALHYCLERWDKLMLYTTNGMLEIDNNLVENDYFLRELKKPDCTLLIVDWLIEVGNLGICDFSTPHE